MRRIALRLAAAACAATSLAGCSSWVDGGDPLFGLVYRIDIQQGNVITQDQLGRLRPGMNRLQVRDILGSPLLTDAFHTDRWDYVFSLRQSGRPLQRRDVVLHFDGDVLKKIDAPDLPTEREFVDAVARSGPLVTAAELELTPEQLKDLPVPPKAAPPPAAATPPAPPRIYPPLEPS